MSDIFSALLSIITISSAAFSIYSWRKSIVTEDRHDREKKESYDREKIRDIQIAESNRINQEQNARLAIGEITRSLVPVISNFSEIDDKKVKIIIAQIYHKFSVPNEFQLNYTNIIKTFQLANKNRKIDYEDLTDSNDIKLKNHLIEIEKIRKNIVQKKLHEKALEEEKELNAKSITKSEKDLWAIFLENISNITYDILNAGDSTEWKLILAFIVYGAAIIISCAYFTEPFAQLFRSP